MERTTTTRLGVGRETAASLGPCESRCSSKSVSRCSSAASRGQASAAGGRIQCLPTFARMTESKRRRTHIARRGRSMGATVRGCPAAPMQSRERASASSTGDAWFATAGPWWLPAAYGPSDHQDRRAWCGAQPRPSRQRDDFPARRRQTSGPTRRRQRRSRHAVLSPVHAAS